MDRNLATRLGLIVAVVGVCAYLLWPTYQYFKRYRQMGSEQIAQLNESQRRRYNRVLDKSLKLGLDLQGGMHLVLEMDESKRKLENRRDAQDRVLEIFNTRIDKFGVTEPIIARQGDNRILIQLPGVEDPERVRGLMQATAQLRFHMARSQDDLVQAVQAVDEALKAKAAAAAPSTPPGAASPTPEAAPTPPPAAAPGADSLAQTPGDSLFPELATPPPSETPGGDAEHPFTSLFLTVYQGALAVVDDGFRVERVRTLLEDPAVDAALPRGTRFVWSSEEGPRTQDGLPTRLIYLLDTKEELTGEHLEDARVSPDPDRPGAMQINFRLDRRGARQFARVTGEHVGEQLAIVLDDVVKSAPNIKNKIPGGEAVITGSYSDQEARDLAIVLRAGALPVDVKFIEERTVGPTLGADSLRKGLTASLIGLGLSALFLIIYYKLSGLLATVALALNLVIVLAAMSALGAALSLPGIAGLVLSVAMAVDANVLIFERIREELRKAKTVNASIDAGYKNAFSAILDSNLTTMFAGIVLLYFGTGPVKGFAVTLIIGITASMFTALFVTRFVFDLITRRRRLQSLSI
jgi:protein-export membrane protein SecD